MFVAGLPPPTASAEVRAATPDLTIVSDARYDVQPAQSRVRVTVTLRLTNHLKDTATKRYYFDQAFLAVLPGATGIRLTGAGEPRRLGHRTERQRHDPPARRSAQRLFAGKSATYTLRFDLVDGGGEPTRDLRIGESLVSFPVWAFASDCDPRQHGDRRLPGRLRDRRRGGRPPGADEGQRRARPSTRPDGSRRR